MIYNLSGSDNPDRLLSFFLAKALSRNQLLIRFLIRRFLGLFKCDHNCIGCKCKKCSEIRNLFRDI